MFDSALELASQAASNSLFIFCFCNLIIAIIFVVSKPPNGRRVSLPTVTCKNTIDEAATKVEDTADAVQDQEKKATELMEDITQSQNHSHSNIVIVDEGCDHEDEGGGDDDDDDDDDELNARIEDFIAKVNREWEAEKAKATHGFHQLDRS